MAHKKEDMIKLSLDAIEDNNLVFVTEIFAFVPFSQATFYNHKLEGLESIKKALDDNRVKTKSQMRKKWLESTNATLQIALYKLLATPEEYDRLIQQKLDHTTAGEKLPEITINVTRPNTEAEIKKLLS